VLCINPQGKQKWACNRCPACRINRARDWTTRLVFELERPNAQAFFLTLTYDPEHLPKGANLEPDHITLWLKRFRKPFPNAVRYFLAGEYGDNKGRPHYHVLLFVDSGIADPALVVASSIRQWFYGAVDLDTRKVNSTCIDYVAQYLVKGLYDIRNIAGRVPPFHRTSPGHGAYAYEWLTSQPNGLPKEIAYYEKILPTPKYIRRKAKADGIAFEKSDDDLPSVPILKGHSLADPQARSRRDEALLAFNVKQNQLAVKRERNRERSARKLKFSNTSKRRHQNETF